ncbi:TFIID subunit [Entamoeba histolytica HM-3:IMSS]|uniref:TFIID subunit n=2 Tax=Entamoeba histolytica TaxID=5759 RepID=M7X139_ENTHI|nr:TFIID subunit [Entamoeba histolytica HM-3:IMSS]
MLNLKFFIMSTQEGDEDDGNLEVKLSIRGDGERFHINMEQPILLRLPEDEAKVLREQIQSGDVDFNIDIPQGENSGKCIFNGKEFCATLVRLPCVVETHKSYDDVALYKTGDIGQAIIIHEKDNIPKIDDSGRLKSGLTPPTNRIVNKFQKPMTHAEKERMKELHKEIKSKVNDLPKSEEDN